MDMYSANPGVFVAACFRCARAVGTAKCQRAGARTIWVVITVSLRASGRVNRLGRGLAWRTGCERQHDEGREGGKDRFARHCCDPALWSRGEKRLGRGQ